MKPEPKVSAAGAGGAFAVVLVWTLGQAGIDMPPEVAASVTVLLAFAAGWLRHDPR